MTKTMSLVDKICRRHQSRIDRLGFVHLSRSELERYSDCIERLKIGQVQSKPELNLDNRLCDDVMSMPSAFLCDDLGFISRYYSFVTTLDLDCNNIRDVSSIAMLPRIRCLNLAYNKIDTLEPFRNNKTLVYLDLEHNSIRDVTPLGSIKTLMFVGLRHNPIESITSLHRNVNVISATLLHTRVPMMQRKEFRDIMLNNIFNSELRNLTLRHLSLRHLRS